MIDDLFDRDYQAGRHSLNASIAKLFAAFAAASWNAFKVLNRIEYSAPWASERTHAGCN